MIKKLWDYIQLYNELHQTLTLLIYQQIADTDK